MFKLVNLQKYTVVFWSGNRVLTAQDVKLLLL